jgi:pimeloyl-ACP methyl ester carboxylesterase
MQSSIVTLTAKLARRFFIAIGLMLVVIGCSVVSTRDAQTIKVGNDTYSYLKQGNGPALVIVHGVGGHKEDWQGVMSAFSTTHTVYAVDMLGFGGSSREASDLTIPKQAAAIKALLDSERVQKADLIGNSVGGWVAASFASQYPAATNKLIVANPAGFEAMFKGEPPVNLFPNDLSQMKKLLTYVLYSSFAHTDDFAQKALNALDASNERTLAPRLFPALGKSPRLEEVMPKIKADTLVIWGKEDKLFPVALAPYIAGLTPRARSAIVENAGHFPHIDQPQEFISVAQQFLN